MKHWTYAALGLFLGGLLLASPVPAQDKAVPEGAALLKARCASCHGLGKVERAKKNRPAWEKTIDRMISKGAKLNSEEREKVLVYLTAR